MHEEPPIAADTLDVWQIGTLPILHEDQTWEQFAVQRRRRRVIWVLGVVAAVAALALFMLTRGWSGYTSELHSPFQVADKRISHPIGHRAVAVAEDGSRWSWQLAADGAAEVQQAKGNIFYRVNPGAPFEVVTPLGRVRALGTCFRVEIVELNLESELHANSGTNLATKTATLVTVYEGRVALSNQQELGPGETGMLTKPSTLGSRSTFKSLKSIGEMLKQQSKLIDELRARVASQRTRLKRTASLQVPHQPSMLSQAMKVQQFEREPRDDAWANKQEYFVSNRIIKYMGVSEHDLHVECKAYSCDIQFDLEEQDDLWGILEDLRSDVGIGMTDSGWNNLELTKADESFDGLSHIYMYHARGSETEVQSTPDVDRGLEREELLNRAASALQVCQSQLQELLSLKVKISIDKNGEISNLQSEAQPIGNPVSECVERALVQAAEFAPSSKMTWIQVRVSIAPLIKSDAD